MVPGLSNLYLLVVANHYAGDGSLLVVVSIIYFVGTLSLNVRPRWTLQESSSEPRALRPPHLCLLC